jgi:dihydroflavonol-4-reductase
MSRKILITGGSGLLGSYLIRWFLHQGYTQITSTYTTSLDGVAPDLRDAVDWKQLALPDKMAAFDIVQGHEWVIHAAGKVSYNAKDKYRLLEINKTGTEHIVNACLVHDVPHLVYVGSIGALGKETDHVTLTESSPWLDNEYSNVYGLSKYLGELEVWRGIGEGLNASVVLPSVILGAGNWQTSSLQMVDRIVHKSGWYPTGQTGFVDVRDISKFIGGLLEKSNIGGRWILNGANMTYGDVYHKLGAQLGLGKKFSPAPKWLAKTLLIGSNLLKGGSLGTEMLNQVYGTFTYDASKSLTVEGFNYRPMDDTIREVALAYKSDRQPGVNLPF